MKWIKFLWKHTERHTRKIFSKSVHIFSHDITSNMKKWRLYFGMRLEWFSSTALSIGKLEGQHHRKLDLFGEKLGVWGRRFKRGNATYQKRNWKGWQNLMNRGWNYLHLVLSDFFLSSALTYDVNTYSIMKHKHCKIYL